MFILQISIIANAGLLFNSQHGWEPQSVHWRRSIRSWRSGYFVGQQRNCNSCGSLRNSQDKSDPKFSIVQLLLSPYYYCECWINFEEFNSEHGW